jgi:hypothetical protein
MFCARVCEALATLSPLIPALSGRSPEDLARLPKKEALPLLDALCVRYRVLSLRYRSRPTQAAAEIAGVQLLLCFVLRRGLVRLDRVYRDLEAEGDIFVWVGRGAKVGAESIFKFVWRKLYRRAMRDQKRREAEAQADTPGNLTPDETRSLDIQKALALLTPEQRDLIDWKANKRSAQELADLKDISVQAARKQLRTAKEAFDSALDKLSVRR